MYIFWLLAMLLIACKDTPEGLTGVSEISSPSRYQPGTRLAKFGDNSGIAVIFVDTKQNLVSIHSLQKNLNLENPVCVGRLSKVTNSQDIDNLLSLLDSKEHYVWVAEIDPNYEKEGGCQLGLCCKMLERSTITFSGKGFIEYNNFPWREKEDDTKIVDPGEDNYLTAGLAKVQDNQFVMRGFGEVKDLASGTFTAYESFCSMRLNVVQESETDIETKIKEPIGVLY